MSTWLCAIVHKTAREYTRKLCGKVFVSLDSPPCPDLGGDTLDLPEPFMNPEECFERLERVRILSTALERLRSLHRATLQLCILEELPYVRVATALNVRVSTIKSRVLWSKRALKVALMPGSRTDKRPTPDSANPPRTPIQLNQLRNLKSLRTVGSMSNHEQEADTSFRESTRAFAL
jgi:RNA polymerase sigma factor (sigma-70 family)